MLYTNGGYIGSSYQVSPRCKVNTTLWAHSEILATVMLGSLWVGRNNPRLL